MNSKANIADLLDRREEEKKYLLSATLDKYEIKELSAVQMAKWLREHGENSSSLLESVSRA